MTQQTTKTKSLITLIPFFGIIIYIVLYVIAAGLYPGGSQADKNSTGFSWINNYWCNLLNDQAINGQPNPAKTVAMAAMPVLCLSLSIFWLLFPMHLRFSKKFRLLIQVSGAASMIIAFFLFTDFHHDLIINLASVFGLIATAGVITGLYQLKWYGLFTFGCVNILLVAANNYFYHAEGMIIYLPLIQKISFASFLLWFSCIDIRLYWRQRYSA